MGCEYVCSGWMCNEDGEVCLTLYSDALEKVAILISHGHEEDMHSVILAIDDQLREHRCVSRATRSTNPRLHRFTIGGIDDEFTCAPVKRGRRFNASNVRAMALFCHTEASESLEGLDVSNHLVVL